MPCDIEKEGRLQLDSWKNPVVKAAGERDELNFKETKKKGRGRPPLTIQRESKVKPGRRDQSRRKGSLVGITQTVRRTRKQTRCGPHLERQKVGEKK